MSLFSRLRSGLKGMQAALLAPAADPRLEFASVYERQLLLLQQLRQALEALRAYKTRLVEGTTLGRLKLSQLALRARHSLAGGGEDAARLALQSHALAEAELEALSEQLLAMQQEEQRLTAVERRLAAQIQAFATQETLLAARSSAAQTQLLLNEQLVAVTGELTELSAALEDTERQARKMQARATAVDELIESGLIGGLPRTAGRTADRLLELHVESQLSALKREIQDAAPQLTSPLAPPPPPPPAPAGQSSPPVAAAQPAPACPAADAADAPLSCVGCGLPQALFRFGLKAKRTLQAQHGLELVSCGTCARLWVSGRYGERDTYECAVPWPWPESRWAHAASHDDGATLCIWFEARLHAVLPHLQENERRHVDWLLAEGDPRTTPFLRHAFDPAAWPIVVANELAPGILRTIGVPPHAEWHARVDAAREYLASVFDAHEAERVLRRTL